MKEREEERLKTLKEYENKLYESGLKYIAGIDEAGRGPLAGPVVVGVVIMNPDSFIEGINDSKKISETKREKSARIPASVASGAYCLWLNRVKQFVMR